MPAIMNVSAEASSATGAVVTWPPIVASDAYDVSVNAVCTPGSGSLFPIGMMPVSCVATDSNGNESAASDFMVSVSDTTAPALSLPAEVTVLARDATGSDINYAVDAATATVTVEANLQPEKMKARMPMRRYSSISGRCRSSRNRTRSTATRQ